MTMPTPIDEATSQFLEAAADDLQRQLSISGVVETVEVHPATDLTSIVVTIRVGQETAKVQDFGDGLVTAYADVRKRVAEPTLIAAFWNLLDSLTPDEFRADR